MVGVGGLLLCALAGPPDPAATAPVPLDLTPRPPPKPAAADLEARRGREPVRDVLRDVFGPAPHPDIAGPHEADEVKVTVHPDGTAKARVPRAIRGAAGLCALDRCVTTRGIRAVRPRPEAPEHAQLYSQGQRQSTAAKMGQIVVAFGWQPASPRAAAEMLRASSDRRVAQAIEHGTRALAQARRDIGRRLAALVRDRGLSAHEKRRLVFELWDDAMATAAEPVSETDALGLSRAAAARSIADAIEAFVRRVMPRGSQLSYTPRELAKLDELRHGPRRFDPYADRGDH